MIPDKNEHIIKSLEYLELFDICKRVDDVDEKKEDITTKLISNEDVMDAYNKNQRVYEPLTQGGIGYALSHKKCMKKS